MQESVSPKAGGACAVKKLGGGLALREDPTCQDAPIVVLALLYSVFRLLLDALVDHRRSDASLRLELWSSGTNARPRAPGQAATLAVC